MVPSRRSYRKSPELRRRLRLTLATAEERLIEAHTEAARDFVRATQADLPYDRSLEIFFRLTATPVRIREAVGVQALASLAEEPASGGPLLDLGTGLRGAMRSFVHRLQGRRREGLRLRVARAADAARDRIKNAYLHGATLLVHELKGQVEPAEAVQVYIDELAIGPGWGERIFHEAVAAMGGLSRGEEATLPPDAARAAEARPEEADTRPEAAQAEAEAPPPAPEAPGGMAA